MFDIFTIFASKGLQGLIGSRVLALIFYQDTLKNFVYDTDASGNAILTNKGSGEDGLLYTGKGLELGATNDLPIAIAHTLGSDELDTNSPNVAYGDEIGTFSSSTNNDFNLAVTIVGTNTTRPRVSTKTTSLLVQNKTYIIELDVIINSGTPKISTIWLSTGNPMGVGKELINGINKFELTPGNTVLNTDMLLDFDGTNLFDISVTNYTIKEVTNPSSYMTIVHGDGSVEQIDNSDNTASTKYTFNNQTILEVMPTTAPFTTADLALIQADTTLLARLALGEDYAGGLSLVTADVYGWYPLTENEGAYVVDAKAGYGVELNGITTEDSDAENVITLTNISNNNADIEINAGGTI